MVNYMMQVKYIVVLSNDQISQGFFSTIAWKI